MGAVTDRGVTCGCGHRERRDVWVRTLTWQRSPGSRRHEEAGAGHKGNVPEAVGVLVGGLVRHQAVVDSDASDGQHHARQKKAQVAPFGRKEPSS